MRLLTIFIVMMMKIIIIIVIIIRHQTVSIKKPEFVYSFGVVNDFDEIKIKYLVNVSQ